MRLYAIKSDNDLFWSNSQGWVAGPQFDLFTEQEKADGRLPMGGAWVYLANSDESAMRN